jgi:hypothetical protein
VLFVVLHLRGIIVYLLCPYSPILLFAYSPIPLFPYYSTALKSEAIITETLIYNIHHLFLAVHVPVVPPASTRSGTVIAPVATRLAHCLPVLYALAHRLSLCRSWRLR